VDLKLDHIRHRLQKPGEEDHPLIMSTCCFSRYKWKKSRKEECFCRQQGGSSKENELLFGLSHREVE
jgi:hypothetical protein